MTTKIGGIVIDVDARLTKLETSLKKADRDLKRFERSSTATGRRIEGGVGGINKSFGLLKGGLATLGIGLGVEALYGLGRAALEMGDDLATAAERANIGVERFQTLQEVFRIAEVDAASFEKGLARLNGTLGDLQRGVEDEATKALKKMGVESRVLSGEITTTDQLIDAITESSQTFGTEAEFTSAVIDIFGQRLGSQFAPALNKTSEAMKEAEQSVRDAGMVLDEFSITQLANANEAIDRFAAQSKVTFAYWAADAIEQFNRVADAFNDISSRGLFTVRNDGQDSVESDVNQLFGITNFTQFQRRFTGNTAPSSGPAIAAGSTRDAPKSKSGGKGRSKGSAKSGLSEEQRLTQEYEKQIEANAQILELQNMRFRGLDVESNIKEGIWAIERKFPKLEAGRLEILKEQVRQIETQKDRYESLLEVINTQYGGDIVQDQEAIAAELEALMKANGYGADQIKNSNIQIAKSFQDMANNTIASIQQMTNAIQGGSFLDIFGAVVGLGLQLGSVGAFGKSIQKNINAVPGKATGGYSPGGVTMVGEYGPEMVNLPRGSQVVPNHRLGGGGGSGSPYFDLRGAVMTQDLLNQMNQIGAVAAVQGGNMGSSGALKSLARSNSRSLA